MRDRLLADWRSLIVEATLEQGDGGRQSPGSVWVHALVDAAHARADGAPSFRQAVRRWLEDTGRTPAALQQSRNALGTLTLDLERSSSLRRTSPTLHRLLSAGWPGEPALTASRRRWVERLGVADLFADVLDFWRRQAASADADETAKLLLGRMETDPYGFTYSLERDAVKVMSTDGLAAFERQVKARFEATDAVEEASEHASRRDPAYPRRRRGDILRAIYTRQRDVRAYVALCEQTQLSAQDCLAVAAMLTTRRHRDEALAWVDRGLALEKTTHANASMARHDLVRLRRELLTKLGRHGDAIEDAWAAFRGGRSTFSYGDLMRLVPKAERAAWHAKTMDAAERADLGSLIDLWLETREVERLVRRLRTATDPEIEELSHFRTEPAARRLAKSHPDVAAKVSRALGTRILKAKKSKYYETALSHFENAKRRYERSDLNREWAALVAEVRQAHHRKAGFMAGFERLAAGQSPSDAPSFLDRARHRWSARTEP